MKKIFLAVVVAVVVFLSPCNLFAREEKNIALVKEIFECFGYRIGQRIDRNKVDKNGILIIKPQKKISFFDIYIIRSYPSNINENENIIYGLMANKEYPFNDNEVEEFYRSTFYSGSIELLLDKSLRFRDSNGIRYLGGGYYPNIYVYMSHSLYSFGIIDDELGYMLFEKRLTSNDEIDKYVSQLYLNEGGCRAFDIILKDDFKMSDGDEDLYCSLSCGKHMFRIPGANFFKCAKGEFVMGSPESSKKVKILKPFGISGSEVSQDLYKDIIGKNPSKFKTNDEHKKRPVENISFDEALAFCEELNKKYRILLPKDYKFDLPTEMQWEYACRSANKDDKPDEGGYGAKFWFADNSDNMTHGIYDEYKGEYIYVRNRWELENMRGNVAEWCWDETKQKCVIRGGSFRSSAEECKPFARREGKRDERYDDVGFRIVVTPIE